MVHVALLLGCAVVIYLACEWFVNAVEWLGVRLRFGPIAVGTILAAAGTALPESVVTLVAVAFGDGSRARDEIGVGAALGGPLVVGTIAYAVLGAMLLLDARRQRPAPAPSGLARIDHARLGRDQLWFVAIFVAKVGLGLVAFRLKPWLGIAFFVAYGLYFWREVNGGGDASTGEELEPLRLQPRRPVPTTVAVVVQTLVTLVLVFGASQLFVHQLEWVGPAVGLPPVVVALLLSPVATELPEIMNAIIWVRQGKTELAAANISGAMMIQATVPSGIGLLFTPWLFDTPLLLAGAATLASVLYLTWLFHRRAVTPWRLVGASGFYVAFAVALVHHVS